jgi:NACHT domain
MDARVPRHYRWLRRWSPLVVMPIVTLAVVVPLVLDLVGVLNVRDDCNSRPVACALATNVVVTFFALAIAYFALFGWKFERAISSYRRKLREGVASMVGGEGPHVAANRAVRGAACRRLAKTMSKARGPALLVVSGGDGAGKTTFLAGLADELASRRWMPVPISVEHRETADLKQCAKERFLSTIESSVDSEGSADAIWRRLRSTHRLVILVEGLDQCKEFDTGSHTTRERLSEAVTDVLRSGIALVLITVNEELLADSDRFQPIREHLDFLDRNDARRFLRERLGLSSGTRRLDDHLEVALEALEDPVEGLRAAPFHLSRLADLADAMTSNGAMRQALRDLPANSDAARTTLLQLYVRGVEAGDVAPRALALHEADRWRNEQRRAEAVAATTTLASELFERCALSLGREQLAGHSAEAIDDALTLELLHEKHDRLEFPSETFRAYFIAEHFRSETEPASLTSGWRELQDRPLSPLRRQDRHGLDALVMWYVMQTRRRPKQIYDDCVGLLNMAPGGGTLRPALLATVARIVAARGSLDPLVDEVVDQAEKTDGRSDEKLMLIQGLALIDRPATWRLLWNFAMDRNYAVEWAAARALARGGPSAFAATSGVTSAMLERAEHADPAELSSIASEVGYAVGSLAWILPSLRDGSAETERLYARTEKLCLSSAMTPLRGELSLAHGLKLAITDRPERDDVAATAERLLTADPPLAFWHARLDLVQVLAMHGWTRTYRARHLRKVLKRVKRREEHPLVEAALRLAIGALRQAEQGAATVGVDETLWSFVWADDTEVVSTRGPAGEVSRLAADVVLLTNLMYGLPDADCESRGPALARARSLPHCIGSSLDRCEVRTECRCEHDVCGVWREHPATAKRAPFSESFCRRQARLALEHGAPRWVTRNPIRQRQARPGLMTFWQEMEAAAREGRRAETEQV